MYGKDEKSIQYSEFKQVQQNVKDRAISKRRPVRPLESSAKRRVSEMKMCEFASSKSLLKES